MDTSTNFPADLLNYYHAVHRWQIDLGFFKVETNFFHRLLDDYFIRLLSSNHLAELKEASAGLSKLEQDESDLSQGINRFLNQLTLIAENRAFENRQDLSEEYNRLLVVNFKLQEDYREAKRELVGAIEKELSERKLLL